MRGKLVDGKVIIEMSLEEAKIAAGFYGELSYDLKNEIHSRRSDKYGINPSLNRVDDVTYGLFSVLDDMIECDSMVEYSEK
jgi:hypothetical protein